MVEPSNCTEEHETKRWSQSPLVPALGEEAAADSVNSTEIKHRKEKETKRREGPE